MTSIHETVVRLWWVLLVRGLAATVFGLLALGEPAVTLDVLVLLYGAYSLVEGCVALLGGYREHFWQSLLLGVVGIAAGLGALLLPGLTGLTLLYLIAGWAILRGLFDIAAAIELRKALHGEWRLALAALVAIALGAFLIARPGAGALDAVSIVAGYALASGLLLVVLAFRARQSASA